MKNSNNKFFNIASGVLFGLVLTALILIISAPPKPEKIKILPTYTPHSIAIHITGEVINPGLYFVQPGTRVADLIEIAGGLSQDARLENINLATQLQDGQKITIPSITDNTTLAAVTEIIENKRININLCSIQELESLPGIGENKAQAIIDYRNTTGEFFTIEDIMLVPGIGESIFESIKELISIK
ncbi:MAG: ComEA family DNA-binding protein [Anaerolineaceae bacterium]|nr:ComEA family DNA-binding protein [Anaerolineaceae bacterium]